MLELHGGSVCVLRGFDDVSGEASFASIISKRGAEGLTRTEIKLKLFDEQLKFDDLQLLFNDFKVKNTALR